MTLNQAAKAYKRGKSTIQAALVSGVLSAKKNELGNWEIDPSEMDRWVSLTAKPDPEPKLEPPSEPQLDTKNLIIIARLEATIEALHEERDRQTSNYRELQDKLVALLPSPAKQAEAALAEVQAAAHTQEPEPPRKSFWARLVG
jgi:hypothetical protein